MFRNRFAMSGSPIGLTIIANTRKAIPFHHHPMRNCPIARIVKTEIINPIGDEEIDTTKAAQARRRRKNIIGGARIIRIIAFMKTSGSIKLFNLLEKYPQIL